MNRLKTLVVLMVVFSLLCGQAVFVLAQDEDEKKPAGNTQSAETIWVGRGYDATGKYADTESAREAVFEIEADEEGNFSIFAGEANVPIVVDSKPATNFTEFSGKSLSEYQSDFSNKLSIGGSYKLFSGSLSVNFGKSDASSTAKEYLTISHWVQKRSYTLPYDVKSFVRADAQSFIDEADPREVFQRFGTHYIWQANIGGRVDLNFTQNRSSSQRDFNLQIAAKAAFNALVASVSVENETAYRNNLKKIDENGSVKIDTYGGSDDAGAKIRQSMAALSEWAKSVDDNPTLCRFTNQSLRGIWNLASTPERKKQLEQAFADYAKSGEVKDAEGKITFQRVKAMQFLASNWYAARTHNCPECRVAFFQPKTDTANGWYVVGHVANNDNEPGKTGNMDTIMVKEIGAPGSLLAEPLGYTEVYIDKDTGYRKDHDWSVWRASCPANFVALSDFAKRDHSAPNTDFPAQNPFRDVRCVHISAVESAAPLNKADMVHTGEGSGGRNIITYRIKPNDGSNAVGGNFFYAARPNDYKDSPTADMRLYVLKDPNARSAKTTKENKNFKGYDLFRFNFFENNFLDLSDL